MKSKFFAKVPGSPTKGEDQVKITSTASATRVFVARLVKSSNRWSSRRYLVDRADIREERAPENPAPFVSVARVPAKFEFPKVWAGPTAGKHGCASFWTVAGSYSPFDATAPGMTPEESLKRAHYAADAINEYPALDNLVTKAQNLLRSLEAHVLAGQVNVTLPSYASLASDRDAVKAALERVTIARI
jgi:hypothetical protein